ncbi:mitochondrial splicing system protein [Dimargaris verticillata]|uniref:Mitochondrial splicing system protein n=1 Tax=Dimargaris verticillata TaxID=2761393 RepID=A0A9W8B960_9FUNG|nr:mitochondrial splicing system protein [Dimargaris verticillata]
MDTHLPGLHHLPSPSSQDTIFALSTSPGKAGVAVVRISGPLATEALRRATAQLNSGAPGRVPPPRRATGRRIIHPKTQEVLDRAIVIYFPGKFRRLLYAPGYIRVECEDIVELHIHGGPAVIRSVLSALSTLPGFRLAERGEFSHRAFDNDKLDLTSLEGLADLLNAETEAQRRQALRQADGGLYRLYEQWREALVRSLAHLEAVIDFGEDENIEDGVYDEVYQSIQQLADSIRAHMHDNRRGEILRSGVRAVILGPPNAGKTQRQVAIVSPTAGTTRDVLETTLDLGGYPVVLADTAGLRDSHDEIEQEGINRALQSLQHADLRIVLIDINTITADLTQPRANATTCWDALIANPLVRTALAWPTPEESAPVPTTTPSPTLSVPSTFIVLNKADLIDPSSLASLQARLETTPPPVPSPHRLNFQVISCTTGQGLDALTASLVKFLRDHYDTSTASHPYITQARHRQALDACLVSLSNFLQLREQDIVLGAEELRHGALAIGKITGRAGIEQVLDAIFQQFCIGK